MANSEHASALFIDTNILVYTNLAYSPFHHAATDILNESNEQDVDLWVSRQILRECLAAMSRPNTLTLTPPLPSLAQDVRSFSVQFIVAEETSFVTEKLLELLATIPVGGKQIHDANIVATMLVNRINRLLTRNISDFTRFAHLIEIVPLVQP